MRTSVADPDLRYQTLIQLLRTAERLWEASRLLFSRWDLSPSQFNVLNLLQDAPNGWSQTELSRELLTHRSNVTGLVDRLEARGLVQRQDAAGDRRAYRVRLTARGAGLIQEILPHYRSSAESVWTRVPTARVLALSQTLEQLSQAAEDFAHHDLSNTNAKGSAKRAKR